LHANPRNRKWQKPAARSAAPRRSPQLPSVVVGAFVQLQPRGASVGARRRRPSSVVGGTCAWKRSGLVGVVVGRLPRRLRSAVVGVGFMRGRATLPATRRPLARVTVVGRREVA